MEYTLPVLYNTEYLLCEILNIWNITSLVVYNSILVLGEAGKMEYTLPHTV